MKTKKNSALLVLAFVAMLGSCKKSEVPNYSNDKSLKLDEKGLAYAGDKLYDILGYGYDATGRFANSESSKLQALDVVKFIADEPYSYSLNTNVQQDYEYNYGSNGSEYSKFLAQKYSVTTGLIGLFSGELKANFAIKDSVSSKYVYASARFMIKQKSMKIYSTAANLRNYLTANFRSESINLSPQELVGRYGTHVLTDITLGGRLDMNYQAQTMNSKRTQSGLAGLVLNGMFKTFGLNSSIETNSSDAASNFDQKLYYSTVGGDGSKGLVGEISLDASPPKPLSISNWQSSCTPDNAALIKIGEDGLVPLEDLISDPVKSAAVKAYIKSYLEANKVREVQQPTDAKPTIWYPNDTKPILIRGNSVYTQNNKFLLTLQQSDGNLVLYNRHTGETLWASNKLGGDKVIFQSDGNLVVLTNANQVLWSSNFYWPNTNNTGDTSIFYTLQEDGNFVLYRNGGVICATNTATTRSNHFGILKR